MLVPANLCRPIGVLGDERCGMDKKMDRKHVEKYIERPTEDDLARAALGGPRGNSALEPAPLTRKEKEQISPNDEPGHVA
jgi:hypothetical protein